MNYVPHNCPTTPPQHTYYVAGRVVKGEREYVYCMTSHQPTVDSFIRDLSKAVNWPTRAEFVADKRNYPGLKGLKLWKVGVIE